MIERFFTDTDSPILRHLLDHLWSGSADGPPDLSQTALLLPTKNVGRRVRESLALRASEQGRGILSPAVFIPGALFSALSGGSPIPGTSELILVLSKALESLSPETVLKAFGRTFEGELEERLSIARFFLETRRELGDALLDFKAVSEHPDIGDRDRWRALAKIESGYRKLLRENSLLDPQDQAAAIADDPQTHFPWSRLVVAGAPDFPERVAGFLRKLAADRSVEILICAGDLPHEAFDDVGRPRVDWFSTAPIEIPDHSLSLTRDTHAANKIIADRVDTYPDSKSACACGVGLPATGAALTFELKSKGITAHDPAGKPFASSPAGKFFRHFTGLCFGEEIADLIAWFRDPFVAEWVSSVSGEDSSQEAWIKESDEWMEQILPNSISDYFAALDRRKPRSKVFAMTNAIRKKAQESVSVFTFLERLDIGPLLSRVEKADGTGDFADSLATIRLVAERLYQPKELKRLGRWAVEQAMRFSVYEDRPSEAIEVLGWLELLWEEGPWLQIPDFYDGAIPGLLGSHPLLPETLRNRLGIAGKKQRDARDAYILRSLLALRREGGRVDLHIPRKDLEGGAVSPSRLLYFTPEHELPARVEFLSREPEIVPRGGSVDPIQIKAGKDAAIEGWLKNLDRIHVTSFASWIRCPFTFYLERVRGIRMVDSERLEMDPRLFGTGLHEVLRGMDGELGDSLEWGNKELIEDKGMQLLDDWFLAQFGRRPGLLLELQREALARRVEAALGLRMTARAEGWKPLHVEWNFREENLLALNDIPLSGQIDLVEERGEELRIIDYKTKDKAETPEDAHLIDLKNKRTFYPSHLLEVGELPNTGWVNLQLPLYALALRKKYPDRPIRIAYGVLPRAVTESAIVEWTGFTDEWVSPHFVQRKRFSEFGNKEDSGHRAVNLSDLTFSNGRARMDSNAGTREICAIFLNFKRRSNHERDSLPSPTPPG